MVVSVFFFNLKELLHAPIINSVQSFNNRRSYKMSTKSEKLSNQNFFIQ